MTSQTWNHDVFLSFRGKDTRKTFVDHLYTALVQQGIHTYKDDKSLPRGESIDPALSKAIQESRIAVVVFSENYAYSSWCLNELLCIMKCMDERQQIVMPIFYDVEPSDVRKQKRKYGEAFAKHESEGNNKVEFWRKALVSASNLSGWEINHIANGHESKGIKEIVDTISTRLFTLNSDVSEDFIGLRTRLKDLKSKLEIGSGGVRMVGIWGVGGGGKTTLASSVFDEISCEFDSCCFLENIREKSSKQGLEILQGKILSTVLKQRVEISRVEEGRRMIKRKLCHKNVLIILDDVDHLDHLRALAGSHDWFGEGSRIIITTRDKHLLNSHKVSKIHNISLLNDEEALKLFCKHAPRDYNPIKDYEMISKYVVSYAGGLPLALKVLGCFLCDKDTNEWWSAVARLKEIPEADILEKLKTSYDGLKPVEKELFLDIACFYRGRYMDEAIMMILDACAFHPVIGIKVLIQKALIIVNPDGRFDMHDLVQEMGHYIVRGEHPKNPEKHTRVWGKQDALNICATDSNTELDKIEAIELSPTTYDHLLFQLVSKAKNLRLISLKLEQIYARDYPKSMLLKEFQPVKLCCLILENAPHKQIWEGRKYLPNLKMIKLDGLLNLIETPDLDGIPNLERFELIDSPSLEVIHSSLGRLERLVYLTIQGCGNLKMLPSITRLKKLQVLLLSLCGSELLKVTDIQHNKDNLTDFHFDTSLKLPEDLDVEFCLEESLSHNSINYSSLIFFRTGLRKLELFNCNLGDGDIDSVVWELSNLQELDVSVNKFSRINFGLLQLPRLKWLNVSRCNILVELLELPSSIAVLKADNCSSLKSIGDISNCKWLWKVSLMGYSGLGLLGCDILLDSLLQGNATEDHFISLAFRCVIPKGFSARFIKGNRIMLQLPHNWYHDFCGFLIRIITYAHDPCCIIVMKQEIFSNSQSELVQASNLATKYGNYSNIYAGYVSFSSLRHTAWWNSSYTMISFLLDRDDCWLRVDLVPRKSKNDLVQTTEAATDGSEFWDQEYKKAFTIQHDSKSFLEFLWVPVAEA